MHTTQRDPDAVVIGSGPNGLVAACMLAKAGLQVLVLEANEHRWGGAVGTEEATLPGYLHDVGAGFFPWGTLSPAFRELELQQHGLRWLRGEIESCHPAPDGTQASIVGDLDAAPSLMGTVEDGRTWRRMVAHYQGIERDLIGALLRPFPAVGPALRLLPGSALHLASVFASKGAWVARRWFGGEAARRVLPGLALHVDVGPDDWFGAALGYMLAMTATTGGFVVPEGGAGSLANALVAVLRSHGGQIRLGARVARIEARSFRVRAVVLSDGTEIPCHVVMANTDIASLLLDMVERDRVPGWMVDFLYRFPRGWGTFKVDWALGGPVQWSVEEATKAAVVHAGDSLHDLSRFTAQVRRGELPDNPYLVVGQQSLLDRSRAPGDGHTLWAYSRVPSQLEGGWAASAEAFADRVEQRIEGLAPGFRSLIRGRRVVSPVDLEAMDANLVGGDLGGGSNAWNRQLLFRPMFPYFRYRMPVTGLYLASSYAHPGAGVHGMCGYNAAEIALRDLRAWRQPNLTDSEF